MCEYIDQFSPLLLFLAGAWLGIAFARWDDRLRQQAQAERDGWR